MRSVRLVGPVATLLLAVALPGSVLANGVDATTRCDFTVMRVGQTNIQYGTVFYQASDWWIPKTGHYITNWEKAPFQNLVFKSGDAPHGNWFAGVDPNFSHTVWRSDGSFTVWGDATKSLVTKADARAAAATALVDTTTGTGHTWDDWARCQGANGWVKITN